MKNLLYKQVELVHLEDQLQLLETEDRRSREPEKANLRFYLYAIKEAARTSKSRQWMKYKVIQKKIHAYIVYQ
ncbi:MAG: hypothetical protein Q9166_005609 [cf. Caloplaca sp. 2 TL-2023]